MCVIIKRYTRSLLTVEASRTIWNQLKRVIIDNVKDHIQPVSDKQPMVPDEIRQNHMAASVLELIAWWLEHDMPYDIDRMAAIYEQVIIKTRL
jgi:hypothetical protein